MSSAQDLSADPPESATVLVVEDDRELADLYASWLTDRYRVRTAYNGQEALAQLDPEVDIVLLDRRMPDISGDEVLGRIRERDGEYQVAMVTAIDPDSDILKLDFDEYVTKPVSKEDVRETAEELAIRGTLEADLQRAMKVAAKKRTLEKEKSPAELRDNTPHDVLTDELSERREEVNDQLARLTERGSGAYFPYPRRRIALNGAAIGAVALLLVAVHAGLPDAQRRLLAGGPAGADLLVPYLLTFVHVDDAHLYKNVIGYLLGASFSYALCMRIRAERWFHLTALLLLTVLPLVTVALSRGLFGLLFPDAELVVLGFSTVVAGFVGFAFLAALLVARTIYGHRTVFFIGTFVLLVLADIPLLIDGNRFGLLTGAATLLAFAVVVRKRLEAVAGDADGWRTVSARLLAILLVTAFFAAAGLGLFPTTAFVDPGGTAESLDATAAAGSYATNVFGHVVGIVVGFLIAFATAFVVDMFPVRERMRSEGYALPDRLL